VIPFFRVASLCGGFAVGVLQIGAEAVRLVAGPAGYGRRPQAGYVRMLRFVTDKQIYEEVICGAVPSAVHAPGRMVPFLEVLSGLIARNVEIRLLHAKEPGPAFRRDFDRYPNLARGLERMLCPRVHLKCAVVDGRWAYTGSANLTGAGVGAKSGRRRNFESGIITTDPAIVDKVMEQFDGIWRGSHCKECDRKEFCDEHVDILATTRGPSR